MYFAGGVLQDHVGKYRRLGLIRQMRAEADPHVERSIDVQTHRRTELVHRFAILADEEGEGIAVLFDTDAPGIDSDEYGGIGAVSAAAVSYTHLDVYKRQYFDTGSSSENFPSS